ncbi:MAG: hypothetical protein AB7E55_10710 [Pigmentiphaga sp.]
MKDRSRNLYALKIAKQCWVALVIFALGLYVWKNGSHIAATLAAIPKTYLIAAFFGIMAGKFAALFLMRASLQMVMALPPDWRASSWIYASSDVAKYMPGGVWSIVGRVVQYRSLQLSARAVSKALLLENFGFGITALVLGTPVAVGMASKAGWLDSLGWSAVVTLMATTVCTGVWLLRRLRGAVSGAMVRAGSSALAVMLLGWIAMGTSFFFLLAPFGSWLDWLWTVGTYAVAFTAGMIAIFAPAGAGVREGVLALAGQMHGFPAFMILDAALLSRALWVVADVCFFGFALLVRAKKK